MRGSRCCYGSSKEVMYILMQNYVDIFSGYALFVHNYKYFLHFITLLKLLFHVIIVVRFVSRICVRLFFGKCGHGLYIFQSRK